jgi:hypothetical protein
MELTAHGVWTMVHGMGFGALYLLACSGAMVELWRHTSSSRGAPDRTADDTFLRVYLATMAVLAPWPTAISGSGARSRRSIPRAQSIGLNGLRRYPQPSGSCLPFEKIRRCVQTQ